VNMPQAEEATGDNDKSRKPAANRRPTGLRRTQDRGPPWNPL